VKQWARLRMHGPMMVFDWHKTEFEARDAIVKCAEKLGEQVYRFQTVGFFPDHIDMEETLGLKK